MIIPFSRLSLLICPETKVAEHQSLDRQITDSILTSSYIHFIYIILNLEEVSSQIFA